MEQARNTLQVSSYEKPSLLCQHRFSAKSILFMAVPNLDSVAVREKFQNVII